MKKNLSIKLVKGFVFWHWNLVNTKNKEILASSETFYSESNARRAAKTLSEAINVPVVE